MKRGAKFMRKPPCKFWPLGTCTKGKECPFFHSNYAAPTQSANRGRNTKTGAFATQVAAPAIPDVSSQANAQQPILAATSASVTVDDLAAAKAAASKKKSSHG